ncbi:MAG TPA: penicillin-binding transpeptidase domain-containing protein [Gemmatimonadaceae bacterium]|jgi:cell division protein FtsI/penicillin-binding protein 2
MIHSRRIGIAHTALAIFAVAILVRAARVQLVQGGTWRVRAERQQTREHEVPAPRGEILDATHRVLAQSRETVRLEITPREVRAPAQLRRALLKLGVDRNVIARAADTSAKNVTVPGRFLSVDAAPAMALRGVHSYATIERSYAVSPGGQGIIGHLDVDGKAVEGLELSLDSILRGVPGATTVLKDSKGQSRESPITPSTEPLKGNNIVLTINADLQEIAERALGEAVARMDAEGGDIVIVDPHDGSILAMASRRLDPRATAATVVTEPFEPGSTMKPILAAGLLDRGRVSDADSVDTGNGVLVIKGRQYPIRDEHKVGKAPLSEVLRWSSNVGIVKFTQRLSAREEFETLRDFGFGTPTGLPYPSESGGMLRSPSAWSDQSPHALAMGYEISVTPLQLAMAYSVFANGGELVEPALVKEVVAPNGTVRFRHSKRVVRRVISKPVADKIRHILLDVVDEGTALKAAIDNYLLAGKTGTPRSVVHGQYVAGRYNPNFVGIFPGDNPQYVIVVKLTAPQTSIYASETAAPVTKAILQAAVAARDAALDRGRLASSKIPRATGAGSRLDVEESGGILGAAEDTGRAESSTFVVTLPAPRQQQASRAARRIPDVRGLSLRDAVRSLHEAGFRVQLTRTDGSATSSVSTSPAAGELAPTGTLVRLVFDY